MQSVISLYKPASPWLSWGFAHFGEGVIDSYKISPSPNMAG